MAMASKKSSSTRRRTVPGPVPPPREDNPTKPGGPTPVRRVNLSIGLESTFGRQIVRGVMQYVRKHPWWTLAAHDAQPYVPCESARDWPADGIIASAYTPSQVAGLRAAGVPVVNVSSAEFDPPLVTVCADNTLVGQLGARHLVEKGLERFAFVGSSPGTHEQVRFAGFGEELARQGFTCDSYFHRPTPAGGATVLSTDGRAYTRFLATLRRPVGIMAANDRHGFGVLEACRAMGLRCPDEVAVVGCDNDEVSCNLAHVTMSSVDPAADRIGYLAAEALELLMDGRPPPRPRQLVAPRGVEFRSSTDVRGVVDPDVSAALRFIRDHAGDFIDVPDVLGAVPVTRRSLERRFAAAVGHGIYEEIQRVHVGHARGLLERTDLSLTQVALASGYHGVSRFQANFRRIVGTSAAQYRQRFAG
jgi:LacI family transcriptional regulator